MTGRVQKGLLAVGFLVSVCTSLLAPGVARATGGVDWTQATANADWSDRWGPQALVFDGKMWIIGGYGGGNLNDVWSSTDGVNWTQATANAAWSARSDIAAAVYDNKLWILGGYGGGEHNDVWYSADGATWTQATANAPWQARDGATAVAFDGKLWIMGGINGSSTNLNDVWYTTDGANWTQATASADWSARWWPAATVYDGKMWLTGGCGASCTGLNDVWSSTDGANWTQATANAGWQGRWDPTFLSAGGKLWIMGGGDDNLNDVWSSADGVTWTEVTAAADWEGRDGQAGVAYNNKLWIMGGWGSTANANLNDVWYTDVPVASPALDATTDRNGDGTLDSGQPNLKAYVSSVGGKTVAVETDNACTTSSASSVTEASQAVADPGYEYPEGLVNFAATCGTSGYTTTVKVYYYGVTNDNFVVRKYNPASHGYSAIAGASLVQTTIYGQSVLLATYQVTDGGTLDADGQANGVIVDPAGLARNVLGVPNTGLGALSRRAR